MSDVPAFQVPGPAFKTSKHLRCLNHLNEPTRSAASCELRLRLRELGGLVQILDEYMENSSQDPSDTPVLHQLQNFQQCLLAGLAQGSRCEDAWGQRTQSLPRDRMKAAGMLSPRNTLCSECWRLRRYRPSKRQQQGGEPILPRYVKSPGQKGAACVFTELKETRLSRVAGRKCQRTKVESLILTKSHWVLEFK